MLVNRERDDAASEEIGIDFSRLPWSGSPLVCVLSKVVAVLGSDCLSRSAPGLLSSKGVRGCKSFGPVPGHFFGGMSPVVFLKISSPLGRVLTSPGRKRAFP